MEIQQSGSHSIEVASTPIGKHNVTVWSQGLTIAHWNAQFEPENASHDYVWLPKEELRALRDLLNGPAIALFLAL